MCWITWLICFILLSYYALTVREKLSQDRDKAVLKTFKDSAQRFCTIGGNWIKERDIDKCAANAIAAFVAAQ